MQIYLVTPEHIDEAFVAGFEAAMATGIVSALLIARNGLSDAAYAELVAKLCPLAQAADVAVLLDNLPDAVRSTGADGAHVDAGITEFTAATKILKPEFIAGAGDLRSRHEAMLRGEQGADYVMFGALDARATAEDRELAEWWGDTFEIPAALADPVTPLDQLDAPGCEFIVLGTNVWTYPEGAAAALEFAARKFGPDAS